MLDAAAPELAGVRDRLGELDSLSRRLGEAEREAGRASSLASEAKQGGSDLLRQVASHVRALGGEFLAELRHKADGGETGGRLDVLQARLDGIEARQEMVLTEVAAYGAQGSEVVSEVRTTAMRADAALREAGAMREAASGAISAAISAELALRPTHAELREAAAKAATAAVRSTLVADGRGDARGSEQPLLGGLGERLGVAARPLDGAGSPSPPLEPSGGFVARLHELLVAPLEGRVAMLEENATEVEALLEEAIRSPARMREEIATVLPTAEQVFTIQSTLARHVERLPELLRPTGRWAWRGGRHRFHSRPQPIEWASQRQNTAPETFSWVAERTFIEVAAAGVYAVGCTVFALGTPAISLTVNGQAVARRNAPPTARAPPADTSPLSAAAISGPSLRETLSLPAGARVAVMCEAAPPGGDLGGEAHALLSIEQLW